MAAGSEHGTSTTQTGVIGPRITIPRRPDVVVERAGAASARAVSANTSNRTYARSALNVQYGLAVQQPHAVVLVEGLSDQSALEALAVRRGRNLDAEGVSVVSIGGAQAIGRFLHRFGPQGLDVKLAGLCDAGEEGDFRRGLERAGLGTDLTRGDMERLGFYVCEADLEDELIRALGAAAVEEVVEAQGDLGSFRTLQKQPQWRGRPVEEQLRRYLGSGARRKIRYARLLVEALELARMPRPLERVLAHV